MVVRDTVSPRSPELPVDADLQAPDGRPRALRELRGRVVVLFWEARDRLEDNAVLKRELEALARTTDLALLGVGDVRSLDVPGIRPFVRAAVTTVSRVIGREVLLDWRGALMAAPFHAVPGRSNVLVLDRDGRLVLRADGPLGPDARAQVAETVRGLLAAALAA
jgi:hypothetical protein